MDLDLLQSDVAKQIGVDTTTICNWESNASRSAIRCIPAIIQFLGYDPQPSVDSFPDRLTTARRTLGLSQRKMAEKLGLDPCTLQGWEAGRHQPTRKSLEIIGRILQVVKDELSSPNDRPHPGLGRTAELLLSALA